MARGRRVLPRSNARDGWRAARRLLVAGAKRRFLRIALTAGLTVFGRIALLVQRTAAGIRWGVRSGGRSAAAVAALNARLAVPLTAVATVALAVAAVTLAPTLIAGAISLPAVLAILPLLFIALVAADQGRKLDVQLAGLDAHLRISFGCYRNVLFAAWAVLLPIAWAVTLVVMLTALMIARLTNADVFRQAADTQLVGVCHSGAGHQNGEQRAGLKAFEERLAAPGRTVGKPRPTLLVIPDPQQRSEHTHSHNRILPDVAAGLAIRA